MIRDYITSKQLVALEKNNHSIGIYPRKHIVCVDGFKYYKINACTLLRYKYYKKHGFLVIVDEIQTGIGRTGKFFNYEYLNFIPDALATAKGLGGGLPLGSFLVSEKLADIFDVGEHGTTFGGNPLACATGLATVKVVSEKSFLNDVAEKGHYFKDQLQQLKDKHSSVIKDVRGRGA